MHIDSAQADRLAENSWFKLLGRTVMLLVVPMFLFAWNWGVNNTNAITAIDKRVATVEENIGDIERANERGRMERIKFQDETLRQLGEILKQIGNTNERLVKLEAQFEFLRREQKEVGP